MPYLTPARLVMAIAVLTLGVLALFTPDLAVQLAFRGGLVAGGVALTLALRRDDATQVELPVARSV